jgi:hypothetical protein
MRLQPAPTRPTSRLRCFSLPGTNATALNARGLGLFQFSLLGRNSQKLADVVFQIRCDHAGQRYGDREWASLLGVRTSFAAGSGSEVGVV